MLLQQPKLWGSTKTDARQNLHFYHGKCCFMLFVSTMAVSFWELNFWKLTTLVLSQQVGQPAAAITVWYRSCHHMCPDQASSLSAEAPQVCSKCHCSSGVSFVSLRPHHWRPCNTTVVASARTGRLQGGCHGVSRAAWPRSTILESAGSRHWPTWSSPTPLIVYTTTPYSAFPSVYCRSNGARFLLQHPFSGTPCHWTFSHCPLYPFSINGSRHFFSVNLSPVFYHDIFVFTIHAWQAAACAGQSGPCRLQLQPLNISWTTVTEPALAASPAADQLQTRQTLLPGYFFPIARLPRWSDQPIQSVSLAAIIHTEVSSVPPHNLDTAARRKSVAAPRLWNSLPLNCRTAPSVNTFKIRLKDISLWFGITAL